MLAAPRSWSGSWKALIRGRCIWLVLEWLDLPLPLCSRTNVLIPVCYVLVVLRQMLSYSLPRAASHFLVIVLLAHQAAFSVPLESGDVGERENSVTFASSSTTPTFSLPLHPAIAGYTGRPLALRLLLERETFQRTSLKLSQNHSFTVLLWQQRAHWHISLQILCWGLRFQSAFFRTLCSIHASLGEVRGKEDSLKCHQSHQRGFPQWISSLV